MTLTIHKIKLCKLLCLNFYLKLKKKSETEKLINNIIKKKDQNFKKMKIKRTKLLFIIQFERE